MDNDETTPLGEFIENAVNEYSIQNGGGFTTGFVCVVERVDETGETVLTITAPSEQLIWKSMGLATYLNEWYRDDARRQMDIWAAGDAE